MMLCASLIEGFRHKHLLPPELMRVSNRPSFSASAGQMLF
jgi:hypothetical protein